MCGRTNHATKPTKPTSTPATCRQRRPGQSVHRSASRRDPVFQQDGATTIATAIAPDRGDDDRRRACFTFGSRSLQYKPLCRVRSTNPSAQPGHEPGDERTDRRQQCAACLTRTSARSQVMAKSTGTPMRNTIASMRAASSAPRNSPAASATRHDGNTRGVTINHNAVNSDDLRRDLGIGVARERDLRDDEREREHRRRARRADGGRVATRARRTRATRCPPSTSGAWKSPASPLIAYASASTTGSRCANWNCRCSVLHLIDAERVEPDGRFVRERADTRFHRQAIRRARSSVPAFA